VPVSLGDPNERTQLKLPRTQASPLGLSRRGALVPILVPVGSPARRELAIFAWFNPERRSSPG
jgi:hypothetical protein